MTHPPLAQPTECLGDDRSSRRPAMELLDHHRPIIANLKRKDRDISPPAPKRQRMSIGTTGSDKARPDLRASISSSLERYQRVEYPRLPPRPSSSLSSSSIQSSFTSLALGKRESARLDKCITSVASALSPPIYQSSGQQFARRSCTGTSTTSEVTGGLSKACTQCGSHSSKAFNPLSKCSTCVRYFHEACRRPSLRHGSDPSCWKCFRCITKRASLRQGSENNKADVYHAMESRNIDRAFESQESFHSTHHKNNTKSTPSTATIQEIAANQYRTVSAQDGRTNLNFKSINSPRMIRDVTTAKRPDGGPVLASNVFQESTSDSRGSSQPEGSSGSIDNQMPRVSGRTVVYHGIDNDVVVFAANAGPDNMKDLSSRLTFVENGLKERTQGHDEFQSENLILCCIRKAFAATPGSSLDTAAIIIFIEKNFPALFREHLGTWTKTIVGLLRQHNAFQEVRGTHPARSSIWSFCDEADAAKHAMPVSAENPYNHVRVELPPTPDIPLPGRRAVTLFKDVKPVQIEASLASNSLLSPTPSLPSTPEYAEAAELQNTESKNMSVAQEGSSNHSLPSMLMTASPRKDSGTTDDIREAIENVEAEAQALEMLRVTVASGPEITSFKVKTAEQARKVVDRSISREEHNDQCVGEHLPQVLDSPITKTPEGPDYESAWTRAYENSISHYAMNSEAIFPEFAKQSLHCMTQEQINAKIATIKKRPSRKATFGELLASARRFRKNVHDEMEDHWKRVDLDEASLHRRCRTLYTEEHNDRAIDRAQPQTVQDLMGLPEVCIPMLHEGRLAFRDGALVNGKLPRPKVIYKIGRRL